MTLSEAIAQWENRPFKRGSSDCTAFAAFVVWKLTGNQFLPDYSTDEEAAAIIEKHGGLSGAVTYYMARPPVRIHELEPGDVALIDFYGQEAIGIMGPHCVYSVFEDGVCHRVRKRFVDWGWKIWA